MRIKTSLAIGLAAASVAIAPGLAQAFPTLQVLHSFTGSPDGSDGIQPLIVRSGTLYGTTCRGGTFNLGTAFQIGPTGGASYQKLHDFDAVADGVCPSDLKFHGGKFFGTTQDGGFQSKAGAIFQMLPVSPWTVTALYGFGGATDGQIPRAGVTFVSNKMYGTDQSGGAGQLGTVFKYDFSNEIPIHSFNGADGQTPRSALVYANGSLWGTTTSGNASAPYGTVFRMNLSGVITWQYPFSNGAEGGNPRSRLLVYGPYLYGVAQNGGTNGSGGTIYKVDLNSPTSALPVYSFGGAFDGAQPSGNLAELGGILYGTTQSDSTSGFGAVFGVDPAGFETTIHFMNGPTEGAQPLSGLVVKGAWLYGTTSAAGGSSNGTVFRFHP